MVASGTRRIYTETKVVDKTVTAFHGLPPWTTPLKFSDYSVRRLSESGSI